MNEGGWPGTVRLGRKGLDDTECPPGRKRDKLNLAAAFNAHFEKLCT